MPSAVVAAVSGGSDTPFLAAPGAVQVGTAWLELVEVALIGLVRPAELFCWLPSEHL